MNIHKQSRLENLHAALPGLAVEASERAVEFEQSRMVALDYVAKLKSAGVYRVLVAEAQGGLGGSLLDWYEMSRILAEADASTGWSASQGAMANAIIANTAQPEFVEKFFADPDANAAWSNLPRVEAVEVDGGLEITGRWAFGTGCTAATYVGGMLPLPDETKDGGIRLVVALVPKDEATIDFTWDPIGLAGTGSHDIVFDNLFVPSEQIFAWPHSKPIYHHPTAVLVPGKWNIAVCCAATHLGLARRAIDEARAELGGKKDRVTERTLLGKTDNLRALEQAEGLHYACAAGFEKALGDIWQSGLNGLPLSQELRLAIILAATTTVHQCESIVRSVYDISGASALRKSGPLQRLYRDASCLTHHGATSLETFNLAGRIRCGIDPLSIAI